MFVPEPCADNEDEEAVANELDEVSHCLQPVVAIGRVPLLVV